MSDWEKEVSESFKGKYGELLRTHSFISKDTESDQVLGTAIVSLFREIPLLIYLAVDPDRQGEGLAVKMLDKVVETMVVSDVYKELYLVVIPENHRAKEIYERYGFLTVGSSWDEVLNNMRGS
ncbi:GNAT family N-acetyltransferase [Enterococcus sp. CWB-B31]|uniref:GNAT family N-acetyltransferase n=1 Tax=Enterococcus sp. CWB-B31 TaxID=2885159 RepID=UPI001E2A93A1|nr:GNAT family N-acetyltransferase [Enterococcus sp. CWB-B31]MCB5954531.1 GNAT family N-acetyltransferase [Enterococcus sp. CWB-B31]